MTQSIIFLLMKAKQNKTLQLILFIEIQDTFPSPFAFPDVASIMHRVTHLS